MATVCDGGDRIHTSCVNETVTMPKVNGLKREASFNAAVATRTNQFEVTLNKDSTEAYSVHDIAELCISVPATGYDAECLVMWGRTTLMRQVRINFYGYELGLVLCVQ